jgi:hypothetical protein
MALRSFWDGQITNRQTVDIRNVHRHQNIINPFQPILTWTYWLPNDWLAGRRDLYFWWVYKTSLKILFFFNILTVGYLDVDIETPLFLLVWTAAVSTHEMGPSPSVPCSSSGYSNLYHAKPFLPLESSGGGAVSTKVTLSTLNWIQRRWLHQVCQLSWRRFDSCCLARWEIYWM